MSQPRQIGRYQILGELGRGGMGRVVKAEDPTIRRQVAIKLIRLAADSPQAAYVKQLLAKTEDC